MKTGELMDIAMKAGEILLLSGAEIYRVEDTILRIFKVYDIECECFVLTSGIFISAKGRDGEVITRIKRLKSHTINLYRIELVNSFARSLQTVKIDYRDAMEALRKIEHIDSYRFLPRLLAAGATAFIYTLLFKGNIYEGLIAMLISIIIYFGQEKMVRAGFFQFSQYFASGVIAGGLSLVAAAVMPQLNIYRVITGAIMILVPGVTITTGIKDALYGDTVSSLYRIVEALFISIAVGAGVAIAVAIGVRLA